jgi:hypothetical protein
MDKDNKLPDCVGGEQCKVNAGSEFSYKDAGLQIDGMDKIKADVLEKGIQRGWEYMRVMCKDRRMSTHKQIIVGEHNLDWYACDQGTFCRYEHCPQIKFMRKLTSGEMELVTPENPTHCPKCRGIGSVWIGWESVQCTDCGGKGGILTEDYIDCPVCKGKGRTHPGVTCFVGHDPLTCANCKGTGKVPRPQNLYK